MTFQRCAYKAKLAADPGRITLRSPPSRSCRHATACSSCHAGSIITLAHVHRRCGSGEMGMGWLRRPGAALAHDDRAWCEHLLPGTLLPAVHRCPAPPLTTASARRAAHEQVPRRCRAPCPPAPETASAGSRCWYAAGADSIGTQPSCPVRHAPPFQHGLMANTGHWCTKPTSRFCAQPSRCSRTVWSTVRLRCERRRS